MIQPNSFLMADSFLTLALRLPKIQLRCLTDLIDTMSIHTSSLPIGTVDIVYSVKTKKLVNSEQVAYKQLRETNIVKKLSTGAYMINPKWFMPYDSQVHTTITLTECYDRLVDIYEYA